MRFATPLVLILLFAAGHASETQAQPPQPSADAQAPRPGMPATTPGLSPGESEGVIRGRVVDARSGRPIANASIALGPAGAPVSTTAMADEEGWYEVRGLAPGAYLVSARHIGYLAWHYGQRTFGDPAIHLDVAGGEVTTDVDFALRPAAVLSGRIYGESGEGVQGVDVWVMAERYVMGRPDPSSVGRTTTDEFGSYRVDNLSPGEYVVTAAFNPLGRPPDPSHPGRAPTTTFYPGTIHVAEAQKVIVGEGALIFGIDFALSVVDTLDMTGTAVDAYGQPYVNAEITIMRSVGSSMRGRTAGYVDADGAFHVSGVTPGDHDVMVRSDQPDRGMAIQHVAVVDHDVTDLLLVARRGATVVGRIVALRTGTVPIDVTRLRLTQSDDVPWARLLSGRATLAPQVQPNGSFRLEHVMGEGRVLVGGLPPGWVVKTIRLDGFDITDRSVDLGEDAVRRLDVLLTDKVTDVRGGVSDSQGRAVDDYTVVIFAEDPDRWAYPSRYVRAARSGRAGQYRITELPPGAYLAVAVSAIAQGAWNDPAVLARLRPYASPLRLEEGEQRTLNLTLSPWRE